MNSRRFRLRQREPSVPNLVLPVVYCTYSDYNVSLYTIERCDIVVFSNKRFWEKFIYVCYFCIMKIIINRTIQ